MKKTVILIIAALFVTLPSMGSKNRHEDVENQLERLDHELARRSLYISGRQAEIDSLRARVASTASSGKRDRRWLDDIKALGDRYNSFNIDSALYYYSEGYKQATALGLDSLATSFTLLRAGLYPVVGFINKGLNDYNAVDTTAMGHDLLTLYHDTGRQMYSYISSFYVNYPEEYDRYGRLSMASQMALLKRLPQNSPRYKLNLGEYYFYNHEYTKAKIVLEELLEELPETDNMYARAAHILSDIAKARQNRDEYLYYLTLSAIGDTRSATLEVNSLQELGRVLFEQGDIDRAHSYLLVALDGAVQGHATMRMVQTAEAMPLIESAHKAELDKERHRIYLIMGMMGLLLVVLILTVWFIRREMRRMAELQRKLERANQTKDIYISQFLSLCSIYMDKLNQFCKIANRKISAGQVDELYKMTKSGKFVEEQSREFYEVFDNAFLHLYPNFVENVNQLMRPGEQIELGEHEKLNTDLRILAFMRLGIEDSSKIAQVLNYSVNTIYTYRNKLKNKAINRENFEADIMGISSVN